jgi:tRNA A-37 threonylcarbamoyl transferase component Bud32
MAASWEHEQLGRGEYGKVFIDKRDSSIAVKVSHLGLVPSDVKREFHGTQLVHQACKWVSCYYRTNDKKATAVPKEAMLIEERLRSRCRALYAKRDNTVYGCVQKWFRQHVVHVHSVKLNENRSALITTMDHVANSVTFNRLAFLNDDVQVIRALNMTLKGLFGLYMLDIAHGDLHTGNVLCVRNADKSVAETRIIDFGFCSCLSFQTEGSAVSLMQKDIRKLSDCLNASMNKSSTFANIMTYMKSKLLQNNMDSKQTFLVNMIKVILKTQVNK